MWPQTSISAEICRHKHQRQLTLQDEKQVQLESYSYINEPKHSETTLKHHSGRFQQEQTSRVKPRTRTYALRVPILPDVDVLGRRQLQSIVDTWRGKHKARTNVILPYFNYTFHCVSCFLGEGIHTLCTELVLLVGVTLLSSQSSKAKTLLHGSISKCPGNHRRF